jgi:hypothetical protein
MKATIALFALVLCVCSATPAFHAGMTWQWQLTGKINTSFDVQVYDIDMFDAPQSTIDGLKAAGKIVVCYFSAGSSENWRVDYKNFSGLEGHTLDGWNGEKWLNIKDIKKTNSKLKAAMNWRFDFAVSKGCGAIEADNVDGYTNNNGLSLTASDQLAYNTFLAEAAHSRGLKIGLKNDGDQVSKLVDHFDFAIVEQCYQYEECDNFLPFVKQDKPVFICEYQSTLSKTKKHCPNALSNKFSLINKKLNLEALPYWACLPETQ